MTTRQGLIRGGKTKEPSIIPGNSQQSQMHRFASDRVEDLEMPPVDKRYKYPALSRKELEHLRNWIDSGADWSKEIELTP